MLLFKPIEVINLPNYYSEIGYWTVESSAITLSAQIKIKDNLGERRFMLPLDAFVKITFMRARSYSPFIGQSKEQTQSVLGYVNGSDRSIVSFELSDEVVGLIYPGTVIIDIIQNDKVIHKIKENYIIKKNTIKAGC